MEKKVWSNPELWQLNVEDTEFGGENTKDIDKTYIEIKEDNYSTCDS